MPQCLLPYLKTYRALIFFIIILLLHHAAPAFSATPKPPERPSNYVTDLAGIINDADSGKLNGLFRELDEKTGAQVFILTIKNLEGETIESFSLSIAEQWKPGQKGKDNGALITVSLDDRKYRIEVGYGLEGLLPDSLVGTIGRDMLVPNFRQGKYAEGLMAASSEIARIIAENHGVSLSGDIKQYRSAHDRGGSKSYTLTDYLIVGLVIIVGLYLLFFHPEILLFMILNSSSRGGGGWSGGGGFGGGGGGSFGGGGSSGSW